MKPSLPSTEHLPEKCPHCGGFTQWFLGKYECRDCNKTIAEYKDGEWKLVD